MLPLFPSSSFKACGRDASERFAPFDVAELLSSQGDSLQLPKLPTEEEPNRFDAATCTISGKPVKSGPKPGQNWEIPAASGPPRPENPFNKPGWGLITVSFMESFLKFRLVAATEVILARSSAKASQKALCVMKLSFLEKSVPQSHLYSLVPQVFEWAFQSDWTAYFLEHFSHFHFFSPCFLLKCFFIPVRSPRALEGSWWTQVFSGQM